MRSTNLAGWMKAHEEAMELFGALGASKAVSLEAKSSGLTEDGGKRVVSLACRASRRQQSTQLREHLRGFARQRGA